MSSPSSRRERAARYEAEVEAREIERVRRASLSLYMLIEEAESIEDVKAILHRLAEGERE